MTDLNQVFTMDSSAEAHYGPHEQWDSDSSDNSMDNICIDLPLVLFGNSSSVKFGPENLLLGEKQTNMDNSEILRISPLQREISEHHISVINMIDLHESKHIISQLVKENEIYAFIYVLQLGQLTNDDKMGLEWIQKVFGDKVLQFMMILFTYEREEECGTLKDDLKKKPDLEQLLEKCGGRFHFCNKMMNNQSEMRELMNKIELLFNENKQQSYTVEIFNTASRSCKELEKSESGQKSDMDQNAQLNLILLGKTKVGKSASGNTILGKKAFMSKSGSKSVTRDVTGKSGTVNGFPVTVYDTPGLFNTDMSDEGIQQMINEMVLQKWESGLCVFLLVIKADRFSEEEKKTVEKIEELLGEERLKKTWILFTRGDELEDENMTIQDFLDETEPLKKLIQKYDQRYHVFNNKTESTDQTRLLLATIIQRSSKVMYEGRQIPDCRAKAHNEPDTPASSLSSRRIVLLGKTGFGKSTSGNTILGQKEFNSEQKMSSVTSECSVKHAIVSGKSVTVVDTPGFFDTQMKQKKLMTEIARSVYLSSPGPHAFLILLRVNDRFTEQEQQIPQLIEIMFGKEVLKYSIILFTHGDQLKRKPIKELIKENCRLRHLVDQCGGRFHIFNNEDVNNRDQVNDLLKKIDTMIEQNGGGHYSNKMYEDAHRFRQDEEKRAQREDDERKEKEKQRQEEIARVRKETERIRAEIQAKRSELERLEAEREEEKRKQQEKQRHTFERERKGIVEILEKIEAKKSALERLEVERQREEEKRKQQEKQGQKIQKERKAEGNEHEQSNTERPEFKKFYRKYRSRWYMAAFALGHIATGQLIGACIGGALGLIAGPAGAAFGFAVGGIAGAALGGVVCKIK